MSSSPPCSCTCSGSPCCTDAGSSRPCADSKVYVGTAVGSPTPAPAPSSPSPAKTILDEVHGIVHGDRLEHYGEPAVNHARTARFWNAYVDSKQPGPLTAEDVCWLNVLQKIARDLEAPARDSLVDAIGYVYNLALIRGEG